MASRIARPARRSPGRRSLEERVLEFFETAKLVSAQTVMNLARGKLRARLSRGAGTRNAGPKRPARPRQMKLQF